MNEKKILHMAEYVKDKEVCLEHVTLENCKIAELPCKKVSFEKCVFRDVVFESDFDDETICIEECEFRNCMFHGNLGQSYLILKENFFKECQFENISMDFCVDVPYIRRNSFFNCSFKNVKLDPEGDFSDQYFSGGKMENVLFRSCNMLSNQFFNMQFKDVELNAFFIDNKMYDVTFENTTLTGVMEETPQDNNFNVFFKCDTSGFTFIDPEAEYLKSNGVGE